MRTCLLVCILLDIFFIALIVDWPKGALLETIVWSFESCWYCCWSWYFTSWGKSLLICLVFGLIELFLPLSLPEMLWSRSSLMLFESRRLSIEPGMLLCMLLPTSLCETWDTSPSSTSSPIPSFSRLDLMLRLWVLFSSSMILILFGWWPMVDWLFLICSMLPRVDTTRPWSFWPYLLLWSEIL